jgi:PAS domain S-box-containing protein
MQRRLWNFAFGFVAAACIGAWVYSAWQDRASTELYLRSDAAATAQLPGEEAPRDGGVLADWRGRTLWSGLILAAALIGFGMLAAAARHSARQQNDRSSASRQSHETRDRRLQARAADLDRREQEMQRATAALPALQLSQEALDTSEARYRALAEAAATIIWVTDPEGQAIEISAWQSLTGQSPEAYRDWGWLDALHPDDRVAAKECWAAAVQAGALYDTEYRLAAPDGEYRWYQSRGAPVRDAEGRTREWIGVCIDIHDRKTADERQHLLTAELDHRVRNMLASIRSMVAMTSRSEGSKQDYAEALRGRLDALARAHGLLTRQRWKGASLIQLLRDELAAYTKRKESVILTGEGDWILRPQQAQTFALVIHELAMNAALHGALSTPAGRVTVTWTVDLAPDPPSLRIAWKEAGGPPVRPPSRHGFGERLILNSFRTQEGAAASLDFEPDGVRCAFSLPVWRVPAVVAPQDGVTPAAIVTGGDRAELVGARILVVEDELLVGLEIRHMLVKAGAEVIGPAATAAEAARLAEEVRPAVAVLDVNLGGDMIDPVAIRLREQGIPFVFVTGYDARRVLPETLRGAPVLRKPVDDAALLDQLQSLLAGATERLSGTGPTGPLTEH